MSEVRIENSNYVVYVLQRAEEVSMKMDKAPEGWTDDDFEIIRNTKYHGILTQFTDALTFRGKERDFIEEAFNLEGNNARLYLIRYRLRAGQSYMIGDNIDFVKFRQQYRGVADFDTKKIKDGGLSLNFNSQELDKLVESYQSDDLSIGREVDLDNNFISDMRYNSVKLKGRDLVAKGWSKNTQDFYQAARGWNGLNAVFSIPTEFGVKGFSRNVEVTDILYDTGASHISHQSKFFYNDIEDSVLLETKLQVKLDFEVKVDVLRKPGDIPVIYPVIRRYEFNEETKVYDFIGEDWSGEPFGVQEWKSFSGVVKEYDYGEIKNTTGLTMTFVMVNFEPPIDVLSFQVQCWVRDFKISMNETSRFQIDENYKFSFVNEVGERLMEILTGKKKKFYSKAFGRKLNDAYSKEYDYAEDGEWGNIALIHGFDIRRFKRSNMLYKDLEISLKKLMDSLVATFNIGIGVEDSIHGQRLRFEKIQHYYQPRRIVTLKQDIGNVERSIDAKMFNSSGSFGSTKGGDYEFGLGLDEPNSKTDYIFPLRSTKNKYSELSEIRSDDTGMELIRRQPEFLDETKDTNGDDNIWYLDLKRRADGMYEQLDWQDALKEEPIGISSPETYRSWRFTPKRSMFRHGSIIRAGMEQVRTVQRYITLGTSKANVNLGTQYIDGVAPSEKKGMVLEARPEKVIRLDNAFLTNEVIKFTHPVDENLMDELLGTTRVIVNGEAEDVPNWYFKIEFTNEKGFQESGYLRSLKPKSNSFEMYKANESMIGTVKETEEAKVFSATLGFTAEVKLKIGGLGYIDWNDGTPNTFFNGQSFDIEKFFEGAYYNTIDIYGELTLLQIEDVDAYFTHGINSMPETLREYKNFAANLCTGSIENLPRFISGFRITGSNTITGNASDIPSGIEIIQLGGANTVGGSISDAPNIENVKYWVMRGSNEINSYTSPVQFNPEISTFVHEPKAGYGLSSLEVDNILIDLYNSGMHQGQVIIEGFNQPRTSASDYAVSQLISRGVAVITN